MPTPSSVTQQWAESLLGEDPGRWIDERRNTDPVTSWRVILVQLANATGGVLVPSEPTIRRWHREYTNRINGDRGAA